jgi:hypothetical protein
MKLMISLLVHEREDVVFDQIQNFKRYVPGVSIIIHIAKTFSKNSPTLSDRLASESKVLVNPINLDTAWADGSQAEAHILNLQYLFKKKEAFDGCIFHASNDLYVRGGLLDYLEGIDAACQQDPIKDPIWIESVQKDKLMTYLHSKFGTNPIWSEIEGSFYTRRVLEEMLAIIDEFNPGWMERILRKTPSILRRRHRIRAAFKGVFYPREETIFPTLAKPFLSTYVKPFCLRKINPGEVALIQDVDRMQAGEFDSESLPKRKYFVLKRINRLLDDPVRTYIRDQIS